MKVAIRAIKRRSPGEIIAAIPVAPPDAVAELTQEADRVVCLNQPVHFHALGYHYLGFPQLTDAEVANALQQASQQR
jgi:putative phosphoribosyl transferase